MRRRLEKCFWLMWADKAQNVCCIQMTLSKWAIHIHSLLCIKVLFNVTKIRGWTVVKAFFQTNYLPGHLRLVVLSQRWTLCSARALNGNIDIVLTHFHEFCNCGEWRRFRKWDLFSCSISKIQSFSPETTGFSLSPYLIRLHTYAMVQQLV